MDTRKCTRCNETKSISEFFYNKKKNFYLHECRECQNIICTARRALLKKKAVDYLGGKCVHCGYNKNNKSLEFHHVNPDEKDFEFANAQNYSKFSEALKTELDKCILLCSNCHREEHDRLWRESKPGSIKIYDLIVRGETLESFKEKTEVKKNVYVCVDCGKEIYIYSTRCVKCSYMRLGCKYPDRESLEKLIWQKPVSLLAKEFGVSGNALRKHCKKLGISRPPRGYWTKKGLTSKF